MSFSLKFMGEMGWGTLSPPPIIYLLCCKIATTIVTQLPLICFSVEIAAEIKNYVTCDLRLKSVTIFSLSASQDWLKIDQKYYHQDHFILESDFFLCIAILLPNWKSQQNLNASNFIPSQCYMNLQSNNINIVFVINHSVLMKGLHTLCKFNIRLSYLIPFWTQNCYNISTYPHLLEVQQTNNPYSSKKSIRLN